MPIAFIFNDDMIGITLGCCAQCNRAMDSKYKGNEANKWEKVISSYRTKAERYVAAVVTQLTQFIISDNSKEIVHHGIIQLYTSVAMYHMFVGGFNMKTDACKEFHDWHNLFFSELTLHSGRTKTLEAEL
eukprot:3789043-Rhodomonas_salina.1